MYKPSSRELALFAAGLLLGASLFFYIGLDMGRTGVHSDLFACRERLDMVRNALESQIRENIALSSQVSKLETKVKELNAIANALLSALGEKEIIVGALRIQLPGVIFVSGDEACMNVRAQNSSEQQVIVHMILRGAAEGDAYLSVSGSGELEKPVCGRVLNAPGVITVSVDGVETNVALIPT